MTARPHISVVTPVYGCATCLPKLYSRLRSAIEPITPDFEILMVNDGSPDDAWTVIEDLAAQDQRVKGLNLSRNFGQHYAITAGLAHCSGEWVVVMDCDLQDRPEEIPKMYAAAQSGYDVVVGRRVDRQDGFFKRYASRIFSHVLGLLSGEKLDPAISNFGIYHHSVIEAFGRMQDVERGFPMFVLWLGFRRTTVDIRHSARTDGRSSYTFGKLLSFAVGNITAYSNKPLILSIYFGFLVSALSVLAGAYFVARYLFQGVGVEGWTSLMVALFLISGLLFANLGILGLYIGKAFNQAKGRPLYVIRQAVNLPTGRERNER